MCPGFYNGSYGNCSVATNPCSIHLRFCLFCFQGADFVSTAGFDVLSKRMKEGKQVCKDLEDFLRQR